MRNLAMLVITLLSLLSTDFFSIAQEQQKVSRLPPLPQPLDPTLQEMFDKRRAMGGSIINLTLTQGHAPRVAKASQTTAFTIRFDAVTPRNLRELAIFRTAEIVGVGLRAQPAHADDENVRLQRGADRPGCGLAELKTVR